MRGPFVVFAVLFLGCMRPAGVTEPPALVREPVARGASTVVAVVLPQADVRGGQGCLPAGLHGALKQRRGAWRLYETVSGDALLLEHDGPLLRTEQRQVANLGDPLHKRSFLQPPIHGFSAESLCDSTVTPRLGTCMSVAILPGHDVYLITDRIDRALGAEGAAACFGVVVHIGEMARFL